jgi:hypothetical protein
MMGMAGAPLVYRDNDYSIFQIARQSRQETALPS